MKKHLFISTVVLLTLVGIGVGGYVYLKESTKTVIQSQLSDRAREFIAAQNKDQNGNWQAIDLDKKHAGEHDFDSNSVMVKNCYSVIIPFRITDSRQNDPCVYYAILESPRGSVTTNLREVGFERVEDSPDVTFRRSKKELYQEIPLTVRNTKVLVFTDKTGDTGKTGFGMLHGKLFTVSMNIAAADDVQLRQMKKIIESVEVE